MVSGFNHLELGEVVKGSTKLNEETSVEFLKMVQNGKPLICSFMHSDTGRFSVVMNCIGRTGYIAYVYPFFIFSISVESVGVFVTLEYLNTEE